MENRNKWFDRPRLWRIVLTKEEYDFILEYVAKAHILRPDLCPDPLTFSEFVRVAVRSCREKNDFGRISRMYPRQPRITRFAKTTIVSVRVDRALYAWFYEVSGRRNTRTASHQMRSILFWLIDEFLAQGEDDRVTDLQQDPALCRREPVIFK